jgi:Anti-sigma-K factor rskA, C-terminal/Putative zinc-finger
MTCAEVHPNLAAFALGGLEAEETAGVRHHLGTCPVCRSELEELRKVNRALEVAPPPATPPSYLKGEILSRVRAEQLPPPNKAGMAEKSSSLDKQRSSHRTPRFNRFKELRLVLPSAAAATLVAVMALGIFFGFLREETPVATIQLIPTPQEAAGLKGYWGVAEIRPQPSGNQQVELKLNNFDEPKPNSYYELWFSSGEKRISAGSFTSVGQGETRVLLNVPPEASKYHTLLITEEHVGKGSAPGREVALKGDMP